MRILYILLFIIPTSLFSQNTSVETPFFMTSYDEKTGKAYIWIEELDKEFIYVNGLSAGVGSNDLGLDRGKIDNTRIVKFIKQGNKLLLIQPNQDYRANSLNVNEIKAVKQAFASSVLWGFDILEETEVSNKGFKIEITPFLIQDSNGIARTLKDGKQGDYKLDKTRSAVLEEEFLSFPRNIEFESILTFIGESTGRFIKSVTPTSDAVTIIQHQSFIALPEAGFSPRVFHPYSGFFEISYEDYASDIHEPTNKKLITRHRLIKKNPGPGLSEPIKPIVYYVDSGCPEPIKGALIEGASWWNQAFTAAGFINAFIVKELPEGAHPLDVRYNVIQWVHRSTRGWSYGSSVTDPRTGEIIKGHVSLGSLRVRQDFMIAQGILSPYPNDEDNHEPMNEMALARLRQLSAHEVGHTIGLAHNFAASTNNRASVMDYPHPLIKLKDHKIDLSESYDNKIGIWDQRAIIYGYAEFENREEDIQGLNKILRETKEMDLCFMSDQDARPMGSAHPKAHLWDSGQDPILELNRIMKLRSHSLQKFGEDNLLSGLPYSELEKIIVPVYLMHRYQVEAVSKLIGGVDYNYAVKGFEEAENTPISEAVQYEAMKSLLNTISPEALSFSKPALGLLLPSAQGYSRNRESFLSKTGLSFDPLISAEAYCSFVFQLILHPERLARINQQDLSLNEYLKTLETWVFANSEKSDHYLDQLSMIPQKLYAIQMIKLATDVNIDKQVNAIALLRLEEIYSLPIIGRSDDWKAHYLYVKKLIHTLNTTPENLKLPSISELPPGSPIGCGE